MSKGRAHSQQQRLFPTAVTVGFQSLSLGVVHHFVAALKTGTKPEPWNPRTCCWAAKLGCFRRLCCQCLVQLQQLGPSTTFQHVEPSPGTAQSPTSPHRYPQAIIAMASKLSARVSEKREKSEDLNISISPSKIHPDIVICGESPTHRQASTSKCVQVDPLPLAMSPLGDWTTRPLRCRSI